MRMVCGVTAARVHSTGPPLATSGVSCEAAEPGRIIAMAPAEITAFRASRRLKSLVIVVRRLEG